jgi:hypothetical protein
MHPSIGSPPLFKIRIEGGAKLTIPPGGLLAALRLAVIAIHGEFLARAEVGIEGQSIRADGRTANPVFG